MYFWVVVCVLECSCKCFCMMGINRDKGLEETMALVVAYGRFNELKMMLNITCNERCQRAVKVFWHSNGISGQI